MIRSVGHVLGKGSGPHNGIPYSQGRDQGSPRTAVLGTLVTMCPNETDHETISLSFSKLARVFWVPSKMRQINMKSKKRKHKKKEKFFYRIFFQSCLLLLPLGVINIEPFSW